VAGVLDLSLMCAYNGALGFQVAIDGAINLKVEKGPKGERVWPVAVAGVLPASSYFAADAAGLLTAHTWFVSNLHPASTLKCPRWQEGVKHMYGVPFLGHRAALVVQILGISRIQVERGSRTVTQVAPGTAAPALMLRGRCAWSAPGAVAPLAHGRGPRCLLLLLLVLVTLDHLSSPCPVSCLIPSSARVHIWWNIGPRKRRADAWRRAQCRWGGRRPQSSWTSACPTCSTAGAVSHVPWRGAHLLPRGAR